MDPRPRTPTSSARTPSNRTLSLLAAVGREAAFAWRLPPAAAVAGLVAPWAGAAVVVTSRVDAGVFRLLTARASALGWLAIAAWLAATALAAASARQLWLAGRTCEAAGYAALTLLSALAAGQASSWGVPLLGADTPSGLVVLHRQEADFAALLPALFGILGCYGAAAPWLARRRPATELTRLAVPPLFLSSSFLLLAVYELVRLVAHGATIDALGRWPELCLALALATFGRLTQQRLRRARTPVLRPLGAAKAS